MIFEIFRERERERERERKRQRETHLGYCQTFTVESLAKLIHGFLQNTLPLMFGRVLNRCV